MRSSTGRVAEISKRGDFKSFGDPPLHYIMAPNRNGPQSDVPQRAKSLELPEGAVRECFQVP